MIGWHPQLTLHFTALEDAAAAGAELTLTSTTEWFAAAGDVEAGAGSTSIGVDGVEHRLGVSTPCEWSSI